MQLSRAHTKEGRQPFRFFPLYQGVLEDKNPIGLWITFVCEAIHKQTGRVKTRKTKQR